MPTPGHYEPGAPGALRIPEGIRRRGVEGLEAPRPTRAGRENRGTPGNPAPLLKTSGRAPASLPCSLTARPLRPGSAPGVRRAVLRFSSERVAMPSKYSRSSLVFRATTAPTPSCAGSPARSEPPPSATAGAAFGRAAVADRGSRARTTRAWRCRPASSRRVDADLDDLSCLGLRLCELAGMMEDACIEGANEPPGGRGPVPGASAESRSPRQACHPPCHALYARASHTRSKPHALMRHSRCRRRSRCIASAAA
jgi:hypothetical protein